MAQSELIKRASIRVKAAKENAVETGLGVATKAIGIGCDVLERTAETLKHTSETLSELSERLEQHEATNGSAAEATPTETISDSN